jgi:hypothetical protein
MLMVLMEYALYFFGALCRTRRSRVIQITSIKLLHPLWYVLIYFCVRWLSKTIWNIRYSDAYTISLPMLWVTVFVYCSISGTWDFQHYFLCDVLGSFAVFQVCVFLVVLWKYFRCLVWYAYSAWFLHLPVYMQSSRVKIHERLLEASSILDSLHDLNLPLFDEV